MGAIYGVDSPTRNLVGQVSLTLQVFALLFNIITLCLIKRQGLKTLDMQIAGYMTCCDILFVGYKLGQWFYYIVSGSSEQLFTNNSFGQVDGIIISFLISSSVLCVSYLAALRFWAIYLQKNFDPRTWTFTFLLNQAIMLTSCIHVALSHDYRLMPFKRYFFPDIYSENMSTRLNILLILVWCIIVTLIINVCYPILTWTYIRRTNELPVQFGCSLKEIAADLKRKKLLIGIKMSVLLIIYNLTIFPPIVIIATELISQKVRSQGADCLFALSALSLSFVNPLTLILLHQDTSSDLKHIIYSIISPIYKKFTK